MIEELAKVAEQALNSFGIQVENIRFSKESSHFTRLPFCVIVGIVTKNGDRKGIFSLEFDESFAKYMLNVMMPGYDVDIFSEVGISAILELSNILCGNMLSNVSSDARNTPPTAIYGNSVKALLNTLPSYKMIFSVKNQTMMIGLSVT